MGRMCRPRQECKMEMVVEEVEESRPVCSVKAMDSQHKPCRMSDENNINGCRRMIDCKIKKKMMKKPKEKKVCAKGGRGVLQCGEAGEADAGEEVLLLPSKDGLPPVQDEGVQEGEEEDVQLPGLQQAVT